MEKIDCDYPINEDSLKKNYSNLETQYDFEGDILFLQLKNPPPAVSVDCNGLFWLRVNPGNGEIVGIEIEGYRKVFLKKYHESLSNKKNPTKPKVDTISRELAGCFG